MKTNIRLEPRWIIEAPPEEMRLILKALGGRLSPPDVPLAKELGDRITQQRSEHANRFADQMTTHDDNRRKS